jgi:hypothetical protein
MSNDFQGTDRLSMNVMPKAKEVTSELESHFGEGDWTIFFEGDRLFSGKFINHLLPLADELRLFFLTTDDDTLEERHEDRGDDQSEKFLKGRKTKYRRLRERFDIAPNRVVLSNTTEQDLQENLATIQMEVLDD